MKSMDIYQIPDIAGRVRGNSYVGRGIVIGKSEDGRSACTARTRSFFTVR